MSNTSWRFVLVALAFLSYPANLVAQPSDRMPTESKSAAKFKFGSLGLDDPVVSDLRTPSRFAPGGSDFRDSLDDNSAARDTGSRRNPVRLDSDIQARQVNPGSTENRLRDDRQRPRPWGSFTGGIKASSGKNWDRFVEDAWGRDSNPRMAQREISPPSYKDRRPTASHARDGFRPPTAAQEAAASFGESLFETRDASFVGPPPGGLSGSIKPNQSSGGTINGGNEARIRNGADPTDSPSPSSPVAGSGSAEQDEEGKGNFEKMASKLPLWPTMGLFASLAANLFFGWIAWDAHSRYQEFVEELDESETRRDRQTRRRPDKTATRRTREDEEAEFLRGGIEV